MKLFARRFEKLYGLLLILVIWQVASMVGLLNPLFLPTPSAVLQTLGSIILSGAVLPDVGRTLYRVCVGYALGVSIGVPVGVLLGGFERLYRWSELLIDFFRSIPVTSLFPLFLFFFGIGDPAKFTIVAYAVGLITLFNTMHGVRNSSKTRLLVSRVFGANRVQQFIGVMLPEALPQIVVGLRLALSSALIYVIVTEMFLGTTRGLGYRIYNANLTYDIPDMYACIFLAGILGYIINRSLVFFESRVVHWTGK